MLRNDAEEVTPRSPEDSTVEPPVDLDCPKVNEPRRFCLYIISFNVQVVASLIINRLNCHHESGERLRERDELLFTWDWSCRDSQCGRPECSGGGHFITRHIDQEG